MKNKITRRKLLKTFEVVGVGLLAAGCSPAAVSTPATPAPTAVTNKVSAPGTLPLVKDKITLKVLCRGPRDFNNNEVIKWERAQTNIDLQYTVAAGADATTKLNLAVSSGDLPDVIRAYGMSLADQTLLAQQGIIIPLDSLIDQYGHWSKMMFADYPEIRPNVSLIDGKLYGMPAYGGFTHALIAQKFFIYQPWLDKLGLKMPSTTDEFYEVLKAFKTKDPNGNGKADEIPLSGNIPINSGAAWNNTLDTFLMQPFIYNDRRSSRSLMVDNGTIKASYAEAGWREGLKYLNKLFAEGLIEPTVFTNDVAHSQALGENPGIAILGSISAAETGSFSSRTSARAAEYKPVPPLKGPTGLQQIPYNNTGTYSPGQFMITKACKNPEAAFRYCDFLYSPDATMQNMYGMKDIDWRPATQGEKTYDGSQAYYATLRPWATDPNTYMSAPPMYQKPTYSVVIDPKNPNANQLNDWTRDIYLPKAVPNKNLPLLIFTSDQSKDISQLAPAIEAFVDQAFAEFVTGKRNPDKDWDAYLKQLNDLGFAKFIKTYQDAYNAKFKK